MTKDNYNPHTGERITPESTTSDEGEGGKKGWGKIFFTALLVVFCVAVGIFVGSALQDDSPQQISQSQNVNFNPSIVVETPSTPQTQPSLPPATGSGSGSYPQVVTPTPSVPTPSTPVVEEPVFYTVEFQTLSFAPTPASQRVQAGDTVKEPSVSSETHTLVGWSVLYGDDGLYNFYQPVYSDMTLVAQWEPIPGKTPQNPIMISKPEELLSMDSSLHYKLACSIDLSSSYSDYVIGSYPNLDMGGYKISSTGLGTSASPYRITSAADFMRIADEPEANYILMNDIALSSSSSFPESLVFYGTLDGQGHTVSAGGYTITIPPTAFNAEKSFGMFGENKGTIRNIVFKDFAVYGATCHDGVPCLVGVVAGKNTGLLQDVTVANPSIWVNRLQTNVGFVTGYNGGRIVDSAVSQGVLYSNGNIGGICAANHGLLSNVVIRGNGGNSDSAALISYEETALLKYLGYNGRSAAFICGENGPTGIVENAYVTDARMEYRTAVDRCYIATFIGWNTGRLVGHNADSIFPGNLLDISVNNGYVA